MSPEQAKGKEADRASDIWAFGCVLYEMLAGHAAFEGETVGEILAGVFKAEPDWRQLPANTPEAIRRLLRRCLQKDRKQRLSAANDARIEIEEGLNAPAAVTPLPIATGRNSRLAMMRRVLVEFARSRQYQKRGGGARKTSLDVDVIASPQRGQDLVALDEALQALAADYPRQAQVVELRFFGGLNAEETAEVLQVSAVTVMRDWQLAKVWLARELKKRESNARGTITTS